MPTFLVSSSVVALTVAFGAAAVGCSAPPPLPVKAPEPVAALPPPPPPPPAPAPPTQLEIKGQIEFESGYAVIKESKDSLDVLNSVQKTMKDNASITKLRVEGHTDNDGAEEMNTKLSQMRADAVVKWLSSHGVEAKRLTPVGCGPKVPLVPNTSNENKQKNRRTEFDVEERDGKKPEGYIAPCTPAPAPAAPPKKS